MKTIHQYISLSNERISSIDDYITEKLKLKNVRKYGGEEYILLDTVNIDLQYDDDDLTDDDKERLMEQDVEYFKKLIDNNDKEYDGFILYDYLKNDKIDLNSIKYHTYLSYLYYKCTDNCYNIIVKWIDGKLELDVRYATSSRTYYIIALTKEGIDIIKSFLDGYNDKYFNGLSEEEFYNKFLKDEEMIIKFDKKYFDL